MSVYNIYFSPTGGTKKVSETIAKEFNNYVIDVDLSSKNYDFKKHTFNSEDTCIISVPSFGGRVPATALERLKQMKANGGKAVIIAVYGNRAYEDTLIELKDELHNVGFKIIAGISVVAEHSIFHNFAKGRPDDLDLLELKSFAQKIIKNVADNSQSDEPKIPGNVPYKTYTPTPLKIKTNGDCSECLTCAKLCPCDAVCLENPKQIDYNKCINCMRCISVCPNNSKSLSKIILKIGEHRLRPVCSQNKKNELFI